MLQLVNLFLNPLNLEPTSSLTVKNGAFPHPASLLWIQVVVGTCVSGLDSPQNLSQGFVWAGVLANRAVLQLV